MVAFPPYSTRRWAALLLATGAVYFGAHVMAAATGASNLCFSDRTAFIDSLLGSMGSWLLVCVAGVLLAVLAWRYDRLDGGKRQAVLVACVIAGSVAGVIEWWSALYFLFPAAFLTMAHGEALRALPRRDPA
jgi:hypothetical protein